MPTNDDDVVLDSEGEQEMVTPLKPSFISPSIAPTAPYHKRTPIVNPTSHSLSISEFTPIAGSSAYKQGTADISNISAFDTTPGNNSKDSIHASTIQDTPYTAVKTPLPLAQIPASSGSTSTLESPTVVRPKPRPRPQPPTETSSSSPGNNHGLNFILTPRISVPGKVGRQVPSSSDMSKEASAPAVASSSYSAREIAEPSDIIDLSSSDDEGTKRKESTKPKPAKEPSKSKPPAKRKRAIADDDDSFGEDKRLSDPDDDNFSDQPKAKAAKKKEKKPKAPRKSKGKDKASEVASEAFDDYDDGEADPLNITPSSSSKKKKSAPKPRTSKAQQAFKSKETIDEDGDDDLSPSHAARAVPEVVLERRPSSTVKTSVAPPPEAGPSNRVSSPVPAISTSPLDKPKKRKTAILSDEDDDLPAPGPIKSSKTPRNRVNLSDDENEESNPVINSSSVTALPSTDGVSSPVPPKKKKKAKVVDEQDDFLDAGDGERSAEPAKKKRKSKAGLTTTLEPSSSTPTAAHSLPVPPASVELKSAPSSEPTAGSSTSEKESNKKKKKKASENATADKVAQTGEALSKSLSDDDAEEDDDNDPPNSKSRSKAPRKSEPSLAPTSNLAASKPSTSLKPRLSEPLPVPDKPREALTISEILRKTGMSAQMPPRRLSSGLSKSHRIAPLHARRVTPPPKPPPLPKTKKPKKKGEEDSDDYNSEEEYNLEGLTEKQKKQRREEKRMKRLYSP